MKRSCIAVGYPLGFSFDGLHQTITGYRMETQESIKVISIQALLLWTEICSSGEYLDGFHQDAYDQLTDAGLVLEASCKEELLPQLLHRAFVRQGNGWLTDHGEWCILLGDKHVALDRCQMTVWQNVTCFSEFDQFNSLCQSLDTNVDRLIEILQFLCSNELVYIL